MDGGNGQDNYKLDAKYFREFVKRFDFIHKFRKEDPNWVEYSWTCRGSLVSFRAISTES